jgi:hypothetical protein
MNMNHETIEELVYEYGHLQYKLGRMETNEQSSMKEYTKTTDQKEKILKQISDYFKQANLKR